jgi:beta-glucosidase-like glycosyl hydrolase
LGATFNQSIWKQMGSIIGLELRALWLQNVGENHPSNLPHIGLDCWSPNIDILRDPRWGRSMEVPSEDPYLNGLYGIQYTLGLQNNSALDDRYLQGVATLKHFMANSLEGIPNQPYSPSRHSVNAKISLYDLASTYLLPFKETIQQGGAAGIMCSYNRVNGLPMCANEHFLKQVLRKEWNFRGYITSDSGALDDFHRFHNYTKTPNETVELAIRAGCDIESAMWHHNEPWSTGGNYIDYLPTAVRQQRIPETVVDQAVRNALEVRFRLGLFDPIEDQPFWQVPPPVVQAESHVQAAKDATAQGFVLLKNSPDILPLNPSQKIALVGPHVYDRNTMLGNYNGEICPPKGDTQSVYGCVTSFEEGFRSTVEAQGGTLSSVKGCDVYGDKNASAFESALAIARDADVVIFLGGLNTSLEAESRDRTDVLLPTVQQELITELAKVNSNIVLVLMHGGMVAVESVVDAVASLISVGYPGRYAGELLPAALFGLTDRAWGKLTTTWYKGDAMAQFDMVDFDMTRPPGRTYRYYTGQPLFEFGYGLNPLTKFRFENIQVHHDVTFDMSTPTTCAKNITVCATVRNYGNRAGDEVILAYLVPQDIPMTEPASKLRKQLFAFERIHLTSQQAQDVCFEIDQKVVSLYDDYGFPRVFPGRYLIRLDTGIEAVEQPLDISVSSSAVSYPCFLAPETVLKTKDMIA